VNGNGDPIGVGQNREGDGLSVCVKSVGPDEIEQFIKGSIDQKVRVVYADGKAEELFVHTVDDLLG
jgi:hypothetical protein